MLAANVAQADEFVRADCRGLIAPSAELRYDTPQHARWYKRFWTGGCDDLPTCFPGPPNWNDYVDKLLVKGGPKARPMLLPKACRVGQLIGQEWSRSKKIKRITNGDLRAFDRMIADAGDPLRGLDLVEAKARMMTTPR